MLRVQEVTFIPGPGGGELKAVMALGNQQLMTTLPLDGDDPDLSALLARLEVRVQHVSFVPSASGGEIRAMMSVGDRSFVSRLVVDSEDQGLRSALDQLLDTVGKNFVERLRSEIQQESAADRGRTAQGNASAGTTNGRDVGADGQLPHLGFEPGRSADRLPDPRT